MGRIVREGQALAKGTGAKQAAGEEVTLGWNVSNKGEEIKHHHVLGPREREREREREWKVKQQTGMGR